MLYRSNSFSFPGAAPPVAGTTDDTRNDDAMQQVPVNSLPNPFLDPTQRPFTPHNRNIAAPPPNAPHFATGPPKPYSTTTTTHRLPFEFHKVSASVSQSGKNSISSAATTTTSTTENRMNESLFGGPNRTTAVSSNDPPLLQNETASRPADTFAAPDDACWVHVLYSTSSHLNTQTILATMAMYGAILESHTNNNNASTAILWIRYRSPIVAQSAALARWAPEDGVVSVKLGRGGGILMEPTVAAPTSDRSSAPTGIYRVRYGSTDSVVQRGRYVAPDRSLCEQIWMWILAIDDDGAAQDAINHHKKTN